MDAARGLTTSPTLLRELGQPGSDEAWRTFLARYRPLILARFHNLGLPFHHIEEVYDDVVFQLVRAMRGFVYDPSYRFRGYLKTVVKHEVWDFYRRRGRESRIESIGDRDFPDDADTEEHVGEIMGEGIEEIGRAVQVIERARRRTTPRDWEVFEATEINGEKTSDVAARFGLKPSYVYVITGRVWARIREERSGAGEDPFEALSVEQIDELMSRLRQAR